MTLELFNADCLEKMKDISDNSIDILYTDPPYIPPQHSSTLTKYKKSLSEMAILECFYKSFLLEINRILKSTGIIIIYCNSDSYPMFYIHLYSYVKKMRCFIWDKITCSLGYTFRHQHEMILYAERPEMKCIKCGTGDIFKFKCVKANEKDHPAEKPIELHEHILKTISKEGDIIIDPFMGTGSIGMVCKNLNLNYIGIEIEPSYFDRAREKLIN